MRNKVRTFTGKIKLEGINPDLLHKGNKGTYLNIEIIEWDSEDKVGNTVSLHQIDHRGLLGGCREYNHVEVSLNVLDDLGIDLTNSDDVEDDVQLSDSSFDWSSYDD